jgi:hypothetical protein
MKVLFLPEIRQYVIELEDILFEKEYFGFEESAVQYVRELISDIEKTLPMRVGKIAPSYFNRYGKGMHYAIFQKNKTTQWYVFYTKYQKNNEIIYLVRYINNNHMIAHLL